MSEIASPLYEGSDLSPKSTDEIDCNSTSSPFHSVYFVGRPRQRLFQSHLPIVIALFNMSLATDVRVSAFGGSREHSNIVVTGSVLRADRHRHHCKQCCRCRHYDGSFLLVRSCSIVPLCYCLKTSMFFADSLDA